MCIVTCHMSQPQRIVINRTYLNRIYLKILASAAFFSVFVIPRHHECRGCGLSVIFAAFLALSGEICAFLSFFCIVTWPNVSFSTVFDAILQS